MNLNEQFFLKRKQEGIKLLTRILFATLGQSAYSYQPHILITADNLAICAIKNCMDKMLKKLTSCVLGKQVRKDVNCILAQLSIAPFVR